MTARVATALALASAACGAPTAAPASSPASAPIGNASSPPPAASPQDTPLWIVQDGEVTPLPPGRSTLTLAAAPFEIGWWALDNAGDGLTSLRAFATTEPTPSAGLADGADTAGTWFELGRSFAQDVAPQPAELPIDMDGCASIFWASPEDRRAELEARVDDRAQLSWSVSRAWLGAVERPRPVEALAGIRLWLALFVDQDADQRFDVGEWAVIELTLE